MKILLPIIVSIITTIELAYGQATVMVPMRDSAHLATNIYLPPDTALGPVPVVINRTPYGRGPAGEFQDSLFAHGIGFISQDTRGRGASEGIDSIFWDDGWGGKQDGYDAVEWLAKQSWCNGKIGIYGGSAHGITGYLCAGALPSHLVCGFVANCASNLYKHATFPGGCYRKEQIDTWYNLMGLSYMLDFITDHYVYDSVWNYMNLETRYPLIKIPFYHVGGWYDTFCEGNIDAFRGMQYQGDSGAVGNQKIIIGPWSHGAWTNRAQGDLTYPENSLWNPVPDATRWFAHYLKNENNGINNELNVNCYIMGDCNDTTAPGNEWVGFNEWPPANVIYDTLFLHPDKSLKYEPPTIGDTGLAYFHDPGSPMLNNGGRNLTIAAGPKNQFFQDISPNGVIWTSDVLDTTVILAGKVRAKIYASSDCIDTDFMIRLIDVYPSGVAYLVMDGALKTRFREGTAHEVFMTPGQVYELEIDLGNIAIAFAKGHKIRIGVSSALSSRYEINPNTGEPFRQNTHTNIAHNTIYTDTVHPSCIILPILPSLPVEEAENRYKEIKLIISPNPFNSYCSISIPKNAKIEIFDITGRKVTELFGKKSVWKPEETIPNGLYFIRAKIGTTTVIKKALYLK